MHGWDEIIINTQERAVSTDINRLQRKKERDVAELFRHLFDTYAATDDDQLGTVTEPNTIETPLRAEIIGQGLLVKPQAASLNLLVDGGVVLMMAPDAVADESNYKYIRDAGVTTPGSLVMSANASGSIRIDVIECRINPTPETTNDNRDIYNPTTGLFNATSVPKERKGRLEYRVRAGTPGAGMPANQSGWLPLCVAQVPNGTTSVDTMTFWDVRPLVSDRVHNLSASGQAWPMLDRQHLFVDDLGTGAEYRLLGRVNTSINGRRVGGVIRRGTPGTSTEYVDLAAAANQASDFTTPAPEGVERLRFIYALTPFGLPRWARYTDGPAGRVPRAPCGIIVISNTKPFANGTPSAAIGLPTASGLGGSTSSAMMIAPMAIDSGEKFLMRASGNKVMFGGHVELPGCLPSASPNAYTSEFTMTEGQDFPSNAKAILLRFTVEISVALGAQYYSLEPDVQVEIPGIGFVGNWYEEDLPILRVVGDGIGATSQEVNWFLRVPIPPNTTPGGAASTFKFRVEHQFVKTDTAALATMGSIEVFTQGFEF